MKLVPIGKYVNNFEIVEVKIIEMSLCRFVSNANLFHCHVDPKLSIFWLMKTFSCNLSARDFVSKLCSGFESRKVNQTDRNINQSGKQSEVQIPQCFINEVICSSVWMQGSEKMINILHENLYII